VQIDNSDGPQASVRGKGNICFRPLHVQKTSP